MGKVVTIGGALDAFDEAILDCRTYLWAVCSSCQDASWIHSTTTQVGFDPPKFDPTYGRIWTNAFHWRRAERSVFGSKEQDLAPMVQAFFIGVGHRRVWVDFTNRQTGLHTAVQGPFGEKSARELFIEALSRQTLSQKKRRMKVWALSEKPPAGIAANRLLLRVPHL